ncbi:MULTISPECIES: hypothetical protein [Chitinophagaceae]
MKSKLTLVMIALVAVCSIGFVSCKKDTTVTQQVNNAYSENLIINPSRWTTATSNGLTYYVSSYTIDDATLPIDDFKFDIDAVLLYASFTQNGSKYPLMGDGTQMGDYKISYEVSTNSDGSGLVTLTAIPMDNTIGKPKDQLYIYALYIQPNGGDAPVVLSNVNKNDYDAVKQALNIKN